MFVVDPDYITRDVKRFFIKTQVEHLRGMFAGFNLQHHVSDVSSDELEELASMLLKQLKETAKKHLDDDPPDDP